MTNGWGGARPNAGRKKNGSSPANDNRGKPEAPAAQGMKPVSFEALAAVVEASQQRARTRARTLDWCPYRIAEHPPAATPPKSLTMAMDDALVGNNSWAQQAWMQGGMLSSMVSEGMLFLGYPFLSELAQRPEYRVISETIATEMTRKWIRFKAKGDADKTDKISELSDFLDDLKLRDRMCDIALADGEFGRAHLFLDPGDVRDEELKTPLGTGRNKTTQGKIGKGWLKSLRVIEPIWVYPTTYNAQNPLRGDWYDPQVWYVMGKEIHRSRIPTFIGRPVPDLLKPAYSFGGLSLSQMAKPYVDIWLQTRESVAEIVRSFSVMVLETDLATLLMPGGGAARYVLARGAAFNALRDNQGTFVVNKATEGFQNVSAPISGLHELQAQSQEHMACLPAGTLIETSRGQVPIEEVTLEDRVLTRSGFCPIKWVGVTGQADTLIEIEADGSVVNATEGHPIWSESDQDFVNAENVSHSCCLLKSISAGNMVHLSSGAVAGGGRLRQAITATKRLAACFIESCGKRIAALSRTALKSTTSMTMARTTIGTISRYSPAPSIWRAMSAPMSVNIIGGARPAATSSQAQSRALCFARIHAKLEHAEPATDGSQRITRVHASSAQSHSRPNGLTRGSVLARVCSVAVSRVCKIKVPIQPVYNIEVDGPHEFFANGILVHNSVARIPLVKFTGISPAGLNASSDGEMRAFNDTISAFQPKLFGSNLDMVIDVAMISLWGERDPDIVYEWIPLYALTELEEADLRKKDAETAQIHIDSGVLWQEEERARIANDPKTLYPGLDIEDVPDLKEEEESGLVPPGAGKGLEAVLGSKEPGERGGEDAVIPFAEDDGWNEADSAKGADE